MLLPCYSPVNTSETLSQAVSNFLAVKMVRVATGSCKSQCFYVCPVFVQEFFLKGGLGYILKALWF